jgi:hypothetical protein
MRFHPVCSLLGALCLFVVALPSSADITVGRRAYSDKDFAKAFSEFTESANQGGALAKRYLASMYFLGQGTAKDEAHGSKLAHECAEAGDSQCLLMYATSNLVGSGIAVNYAEARLWARKAIASGDAEVLAPTGLILAQAYLRDPANAYLVDGKPNMEKYDALAHRTVAQRAEQVEALDALAASAASGFVPARQLLSAVLFEQSGTGTAEKIISLLTGIKDLPATYQRFLTISQQVAQLGPTRAAPKLVIDCMPVAALTAASHASRARTNRPPECKDFKVLKFLGPTPIDNVTWLPLKQPLVANSYPLTGTWSEDWSVTACGVVSTVKINFDVDGMGGASWASGLE